MHHMPACRTSRREGPVHCAPLHVPYKIVDHGTLLWADPADWNLGKRTAWKLNRSTPVK